MELESAPLGRAESGTDDASLTEGVVVVVMVVGVVVPRGGAGSNKTDKYMGVTVDGVSAAGAAEGLRAPGRQRETRRPGSEEYGL